LRNGKFRGEHRLICDLLGGRGWRAATGSPSQTRWDGERLTFGGQPVAFAGNRSTDFFWRSDAFAALRQAYERGALYAAPNPFTYAARRIAKAGRPAGGADLWTDLRVWAYRDEIVLLSGRASRRPDRLDLEPPGGWLPTYASA
jgi:hypothetical protein